MPIVDAQFWDLHEPEPGSYDFSGRRNISAFLQEAHDANEVFYTEGTEELKAARIWIMDYSLPRSSRRVRDAKRKQVCQR